MEGDREGRTRNQLKTSWKMKFVVFLHKFYQTLKNFDSAINENNGD